MIKHTLMGGAALALVVACSSLPAGGKSEARPTANADGKYVNAEGLALTSPDVWGDWGVDLGYMKDGVKPGDDFFQYVSGGWYDSFEMPADKTRFGAFDLLTEKSEQRVRRIIEDLGAKKPDPATNEGKIAAVYNAYLNTDAINAAGLAPAKPYLDQIKAISNRDQLAEAFGSVGIASPFGGFVFADDKNPNDNIFQMSLAGLGLPDRDYYSKSDAKSVEQRAKYTELLTFVLGKAGYADPAKAARDVMALETDLAKTHWDRATSRNPEITYNKLSKAEFLTLAGSFPAAKFLNTMGVAGETEYLVTQVAPSAEEVASIGLTPADAATKIGSGFKGAFSLANTASLDTWKAYLTAHFLIDHASVLPKEIDDAVFAFYGTTLRGQPQQRERWKRAVGATEDALGEAIGKVYVDRHFPPKAKTEMDKLVANLRKAMDANITDLKWMSDATKPQARAKLNSFNPKIGYPNAFEKYEGLSVGTSALENAMAVARWAQADNLADLKKPVDKTRWFMTPQTVNAYYNPAFNEIVFPAAILQPPFFNVSADPAVNYGAIGGVIGHEIGHGFDDQGAKYDATGTLADWWTPDDKKAFQVLGQQIITQYNGICPLDEGKTCVNGALTLGENIGDIGGLSLAYRAYKLSLDKNGDGTISKSEEAPIKDGLTGDQRFFLAWAQVWRSKMRDEALRERLNTDPHSPPYYRVNAVVRNFEEWHKAFDVQPGDDLYMPPEQRVRIW
jgi:putative endopeptidase